MIIPLIMSGGAGTRLWPLSRADVPKQFHALVDRRTMFAQTLARVAPGICDLPFASPVIVFNERHIALVRRELAQAGMTSSALVIEPIGRNTAPAVAAAILATGTANSDALMLMLPADHLIRNTPAFLNAIEAGLEAARAGALVTFGIIPDRPETGFGYIRRGDADGASFKVDAFVEKPDRTTAEQYLASGEYLWNAGIFLFRTDVMASELTRQRPELWNGVQSALLPRGGTDGPWRLDADRFAAIEGESVDYAVMENASRVNVVPVDMGWDDVGTWSQLYASAPKDNAGNARTGNVVTIDSRNSYLRADHGLLATVGIDDLVVVRTGDTTLVAARSASQDVKSIVDELKTQQRFEASATAAVPPLAPPAASRHDEVRHWLYDQALPFWAEAAVDPHYGTITETLSLDGSRHAAGQSQTLRVRVAARQLYVFADAKRHGWSGDCDHVIDRAFNFLTQRGWHADGGFIHLTHRDGRPLDERRDTYDHAFALLAFAHMAKATGRTDAAEWFERTLAFVENHLADDPPGRFREGIPASLPRRANPHMHLFEAWLAAYDLTGDPAHLARADAIAEHFYKNLFDADTWTVKEFMDDHWHRTPRDRGDIAEPGHHYEWIWLLKRHAAATKNPTAHDDVCRKLFAFAEAFGRNRATGMIYDTVARDGTLHDATSRCWPQTEALKALSILDRTATLPGLAPRIDETLATLLDRTLQDAPSGCWMDQYDAAGAPIAGNIPASTLYHLFVAFSDFLDQH